MFYFFIFNDITFYFSFLKRIFIFHYNIGCKDAYIDKYM